MTRLLLLFCFYSFSGILSAQVIINEVCASNMTGIVDEEGQRGDWIELYNSGATPVSLGGWFLSDNPGNPQKWVIPNGPVIAAGGYRTVFCTGKSRLAGNFIHTNFKLTQTKGESIILTRPDGIQADAYTFTIPNQANESYGRRPNGGLTWAIYTTPTPAAANNSPAFQDYAPNVQASFDAGFYPGNLQVALSTQPGFIIRYTTNGTEPAAGSPLYSGLINIANTTVLKARAFSTNPQILPGFVLANTYFINVAHTIPVVSIAGGNVTNLLNGQQLRPTGSFEYFENNELKDEAYGEFNKHGNDSWAYNQRGIDWITRDQLGYKDELKHKFFPDRDRTKFQRLILKAGANDNYPASNGGAHIRDSYVHTLALRSGMKVDVRTHQSCVLYVNGQYWGVYDLREKVDDADFTDYYYDQGEFDIDYIKTWGSTWNEYGTSTDWYTLKDFILNNDMTVPANYTAVEQQFNLLSLVDYVIINQHTVCSDWLNWNTSWWRGRNPNGDAERWRYALWDMDATFGHYLNYTGIPTNSPTADPCDVEDIPDGGDPQNHIDIFMALYNNPQFKALYVNRYADMLNSYLSCDYMIALLDDMIAEIAPEMALHCNRWGGTVNQWNQQVNALRDYINARCQVLEPSIADCYDVSGPFDLTVKVIPANVGNQVRVNTMTPTVYPFVGSYFGGVNVDLTAKPATGWVFDHWEINGNTFSPDTLTAAVVLQFLTTGMATAYFVPDVPCTAPTGLTLTTGTIPTVTWDAQPFAQQYLIQYRETGAQAWMQLTTSQTAWNFDTLPGCGQFDMQIQTVCPQGDSPFADFGFSTPDHLIGFVVADVSICNNSTAVLDATFTGANTYTWDDGSTSPTRNINLGGMYQVTVQNGNCVATDTIVVTQINSTASIQSVLCAGASLVVGSQIFDSQTPAGQVILPLAASGGCDSLIQVNLTFLPFSIQHIASTNCDPVAVGADTVYWVNAAGCDSLVVTTTTLAPTSQISLNTTSCNPAFIGVDTLVLSNQFGCDSLVITNTTFDPASISITKLTAQHCDQAMVGIDTVLLTNVAGCDSLVITTTNLAPFSQISLNATSCNPAFIGVDTLVLSNQFGCDSLVITNTTFDPTTISITKLTAQHCDQAMVGVDTVLLTNVAGCDSLVITTTNLAPFSQISLNASSCNPAFIGVDTLILSNQFGCDSLVITNTTFDPTTISITKLTTQHCDQAMVGIDTVLLTNVAGCDSLVITTTSLAPNSQTILSGITCDINDIGVDTLVLSNLFGCDSLVLTNKSYQGFDFEALSSEIICADATNGSIRIDTLLTQQPLVSFVLDDAAPQLYAGEPLVWNQLAAGAYTITGTNAAGCTVTKEVLVSETAALQLDFDVPSVAMHVGDSVWITPSANFDIATALWSPAEGVVCANCPETYLVAQKSGDYTLSVSDPNGCSTVATLSVTVEQGVRVFVPNAVRLTASGENGTLAVYAGPEVLRIQSFQLFDRWGNKLFEQKDLEPNAASNWDGTYRGSLLPPGVIVWVCTLETIDGQVSHRSGDILIVR